MSTITLEWYDYTILAIILISSTLTGIYYGCFGKKQSTIQDYTQGSENMKAFPVAISIIACNNSGEIILGLTANVYRYGAMIFWFFISLILIALLSIYIYLPVFYNLQVSTVYEYLEKRFDRKVRLIMSSVFIIGLGFYLCLSLYAPALTFAAASGLKVTLVAVVISGVCTFYTSIGGLKTVVVTDTFQFLIIFGALVVVLVLGVISVGGVSEIWNKSLESGRLDILDFDPDPTKRESFWIIIFGMTLLVASYTSVDQVFLQKILSLPTFQDGVIAIIYFTCGFFLLKLVCISLGLTMYAKYSNCDLFQSGKIERNDQLLAYFVMEVTQDIPCLSGIFVAIMLTSSLSVQSSVLNCLSCTIYSDFVSHFITSRKHANKIIRILVIIIGIICTFVVVLLKNVDEIFSMLMTIIGIASGPLMGVFTMGILCPKANSNGAFYGSLLSALSVLCLVIPSKYYENQGLITYPIKPISIQNCSSFVNTTNIIHEQNTNLSTSDLPNPIFKISFYYYSVIGFTVCFLSGLVISRFFPDKHRSEIDKNFINPLCHRFLAKNQNLQMETVKLNSIQDS